MRTCHKTGKKKHATRLEAQCFADYWTSMGKRMSVYRCPSCKLWHLTTVTLLDRIIELAQRGLTNGEHA
jgi:hypothetical protein